MELGGTRSDPYNVISSLLEKDNIIGAHCLFFFKKSKVYEKSIMTKTIMI